LLLYHIIITLSAYFVCLPCVTFALLYCVSLYAAIVLLYDVLVIHFFVTVC